MITVFISAGISSARATETLECKCANGLSAGLHDYSGDYEQTFLVSVINGAPITQLTPCTAQSVTSELILDQNGVTLTVLNSQNQEIGSVNQTMSAPTPPGQLFSFYLKYDQFMNHQGWSSIETDVISNQDIQAVIFCIIQ